MKRVRTPFLLIVMFCMLCIGIGKPCYASASYSVNVLDTTRVYLDGAGNKTITFYKWTSSDSRVIKIVDSCAMYCTVQGCDPNFGSSAVITCNYKYLIGGTIISTSRSYRVNLTNSNNSGSSDVTGNQTSMQVSVSNLKLDLASPEKVKVVVTLGGKIPGLWGVGNSLVSGYEQNIFNSTQTSNSQVILFQAKNLGTSRIRFILYDNGSFTPKQLNSTEITVNVTCSHRYDNGKITKAATTTSTGIKTYTCECCKSTKTEIIPVIVKPESNTSSSKAPVLRSIQNQKSGISLSWKPVLGARVYYVYRMEGTSGKYKRIAVTNKLSFLDMRVKRGFSYTYIVRAVVSNKLSDYDKQGLSIIYQAKPGSILLKNNVAKRMTISFMMSKSTSGYQIQASTNSTFTRNLRCWNIKTNCNKRVSYYVTGMKKNTNMYVRIRSYKQQGNLYYYSAWSDTKKLRIRR